MNQTVIVVLTMALFAVGVIIAPAILGSLGATFGADLGTELVRIFRQ